MRRNQHGAQTQGVEIVSCDGASRSGVSDSGGNSATIQGDRRRMRVSQPLRQHDASSLPEESPEAWVARLMGLIAYALRVTEMPSVPLALRRAQALARIIHVLCLEIGRLMGHQRPATDLPVALSVGERSVLTLAFLGVKLPEIATRLGFSPNTVTSYLRDAATHLGVSGTENAVNEAFVLRLLLTEDLTDLLALPNAAPLPATRISLNE